MTELASGFRRVALIVAIIAAACAAIAGMGEGHGWYLSPGRSATFGVFGFLVTNMIVFSINLISSMRHWSHARTEDELQSLAVPAMQGELNALGERIVQVSASIMAACIGVIVGALCAKLMLLL